MKMFSSLPTVAIIPARKGSKRVRGKNRLSIGGRTLLDRTMDAVRQSGAIVSTVLSTDDPDLIEIAAHYPDVECDQRPPDLATDETSSVDVIRYIIRSKGLKHCRIALLQLTSPFRTGDDINTLLQHMEQSRASSGVSVSRWRTPPSPPFGTATDKTRLGIERDISKTVYSSLQNQVWALNGAIYIFDSENFLRTGTLYDEKSVIHIMESWRSIDIDYDDDVKIADSIASYYGI